MDKKRDNFIVNNLGFLLEDEEKIKIPDTIREKMKSAKAVLSEFENFSELTDSRVEKVDYPMAAFKGPGKSKKTTDPLETLLDNSSSDK